MPSGTELCECFCEISVCHQLPHAASCCFTMSGDRAAATVGLSERRKACPSCLRPVTHQLSPPPQKVADRQLWKQSPRQKLVLGLVKDEGVGLGSGIPSSALWEGWPVVARVSSGTRFLYFLFL